MAYEKTVSINPRMHEVIPNIEPPVFRTPKEWRAFQVAMKRLRERIEAQIFEAVVGKAPEPTDYVWPPTHNESRTWFDPNQMF